MPDSAPFTQLICTVRTQAGTLLDRARGEAAEQIAVLSGRAASWADQAGAAVAEISEEAAATASHNAAEAAERYARQAGDRLTRVAARWANRLGERVLQAGDALSHPRRPRD